MNILLTSAGRRGYLVRYFKEVIQETGKVYAANSSELSPALSAADVAVVTPLIYDKEYIPFLKNYCKENNINALISLFDVDLPVLAVHKDEFQEMGTSIIVSDQNIIDICNDKWQTFLFLKKNGFLVPKSFLSIKEVTEELHNGNLKFPLIVKPRWGMGSIGVVKAEDEEELQFFYKKVQREIRDSYLKYESQKDIELSVLIQECLAGQEYGFDIINNLQGMYQNTIIKKKLAMRSGETDCAVTVKWDKGMDEAERLSNCLHHIGNLDVDVFEVNGEPYILELNARFGGGYPFSHLAGVNLPQALVDWASGRETDARNLHAATGVLGQKDITMIGLTV